MYCKLEHENFWLKQAWAAPCKHMALRSPSQHSQSCVYKPLQDLLSPVLGRWDGGETGVGDLQVAFQIHIWPGDLACPQGSQ